MTDLLLYKRKIEATVGLYDIKVIKFIYTVLTTCETNKIDTFIHQTQKQAYPSVWDKQEPIYKIKKDDKKIFKINFAFSNNSTDLPKLILLTNNTQTVLPTGYSWVDDDQIFQRCIFSLSNIKDIAKKDMNQFGEIHLFLLGFEYFLKEFLIPKMGEYPKIEELITLPIILAFKDIFDKTKYSFQHYIMRNYDPKELDYFKKLDLNKDFLFIQLPDINQQLILQWLNNFNAPIYIHYTTQFNN